MMSLFGKLSVRARSIGRGAIVLLLVISVGCFGFGTIFTMVNSHMAKLEELQKSLDGKMAKIQATEKLIQQFQDDRQILLERKRRDTSDTNQTELVNNRTVLKSKDSIIIRGGSVYTRWGRTVCGDTADIVYDGIVGGGWYAHTGSAVNPLCLVRKPKWNRYKDGYQDNSAFIYGTEYRSDLANVFSDANIGILGQANMPCAVCKISARSIVMMVPGRNDCFDGWTLEYEGYLMAGHYTHKASSEFICVDEAPEATEAGYRDELGQTFYVVEAACGSLPCPEYVNGREVTCVVCSM